jgi:hypothetical protein
MDSDRRTLEQAERDLNQYRAQAWRDAADRAEIRDRPVTALLFRNAAWEISTGKKWLDSLKIKE